MRKALVLLIITILAVSMFLAGCGEKAGQAEKAARANEEKGKEAGRQLGALEMRLQNLKSLVDDGKAEKKMVAIQYERVGIEFYKLVPNDNDRPRFEAFQKAYDELGYMIAAMYDYADSHEVFVKYDMFTTGAATIKLKAEEATGRAVIGGVEMLKFRATDFYAATGGKIVKTKADALKAVEAFGDAVYVADADAVRLTTGGIETHLEAAAFAQETDFVAGQVVVSEVVAKQNSLRFTEAFTDGDLSYVVVEDFTAAEMQKAGYDKFFFFSDGGEFFEFTTDKVTAGAPTIFAGGQEIALKMIDKGAFHDKMAKLRDNLHLGVLDSAEEVGLTEGAAANG